VRVDDVGSASYALVVSSEIVTIVWIGQVVNINRYIFRMVIKYMEDHC
jgi:hypothetical protein